MIVLYMLLAAVLPACPTEDAAWCSWDATSQGNGEGTSYVSLWPGEYGPATIDEHGVLTR